MRNDHAPLILWLKNFKDPKGIHARWITILENYDFELKYRAGSKHKNMDALSRVPDRKCKRPDCPQCVLNQSFDQSSVIDSLVQNSCVKTSSHSSPEISFNVNTLYYHCFFQKLQVLGRRKFQIGY